MPHDGPFVGAIAVVTGALGKLGPAWVTALAGAGASVVGIDVRGEGGAELARKVDRVEGRRDQPHPLLRAPLRTRGGTGECPFAWRRARGTGRGIRPKVLFPRAPGADGRTRRSHRAAAVLGVGRLTLRDRARASSRRRVHRMSATMPRSALGTVGNFIAGEERAAAGKKTFEKLSPATGEPLSAVARSDERDVRDAVEAAKSAQPTWARRTVAERGARLRRLSRLLERDVDGLAAIVAAE